MDIAERKQRRDKVLEAMEPRTLAVFYSGDLKQRSLDLTYPFSPNRNFLYLTGVDSPRCVLLLQKGADGSGDETLFVERPSDHAQMHFGAMADAGGFAASTGISRCDYADRFEWALRRVLARLSPAAVYLDIDAYGAFEGTGFPQSLAARLRAALPALTLRDIGPAIARLRRYKTDAELACIRRAIELTGMGIDNIRRDLKPGVWEYQLEAGFDFALRYNGARSTAFDSIVAGGANSCTIHYSKNDGRLRDGDLLLLDLGAEYEYYAADISRTFPVNGKFTPRQRTFYEAVLETQRHLIENCLKPGFVHEKTWDEANKILSKWLIREGVMSHESEIRKYLPHGICHFLGLDAHDAGEFELLEPGMVITCEPGVYLPEYGFGIRIEDDVLITENGCEVLSAGIVKSVNDIENI